MAQRTHGKIYKCQRCGGTGTYGAIGTCFRCHGAGEYVHYDEPPRESYADTQARIAREDAEQAIARKARRAAREARYYDERGEISEAQYQAQMCSARQRNLEQFGPS